MNVDKETMERAAHWASTEFDEQIETFSKEIDRISDTPYVLMGDFIRDLIKTVDKLWVHLDEKCVELYDVNLTELKEYIDKQNAE